MAINSIWQIGSHGLDKQYMTDGELTAKDTDGALFLCSQVVDNMHIGDLARTYARNELLRTIEKQTALRNPIVARLDVICHFGSTVEKVTREARSLRRQLLAHNFGA